MKKTSSERYYDARHQLTAIRAGDKKRLKLLEMMWNGTFRDVLWRNKGKKAFRRVLKFDLWDEMRKKESQWTNFLGHYLHSLIGPDELYYVEIVPEFCRDYAKQKRKREHVITGDITALPFEQQSFDLIVDFSTSDHIDDITRVFGGVHRSLAHGGMYILYHLNKDYFNIAHRDSIYANLFPSYYRSIDDIEALLQKEGFAIAERGFVYPFYMDMTLRIGHRMNPILWLLRGMLPRRLLYTCADSKKLNAFFYVVAEKH